MSAVRVEAVRGSYGGQDVLCDVDLTLDSGQMGAVLGPSGSGKTTLLRVIAGLHRPTAGTVRVGDDLLSGAGLFVAPEHRRVGLVPQSGALFPHLDVRDNVGFGLRRASLGRSAPGTRERERRVDALLALAGLEGLHHRMPHQLSGGQQQRVALVRALAPAPRVVLLDEPFAALDASLRVELRDDVRRMLTSTGSTALLVTHDQGEALSFAQRLFVMRDGRVLQHGSPRELYQSPVDPWVAGFLGDAIVVAADSDGSVARSPWGPLSHNPCRAGRVELVVRPEQLVLADPGDATPGAAGAAGTAGTAGTVRSVRYLGHDAVVDVELAPQAHGLVVRARVDAAHVPQVGCPVLVSVRGPVRAYELSTRLAQECPSPRIG